MLLSRSHCDQSSMTYAGAAKGAHRFVGRWRRDYTTELRSMSRITLATAAVGESE